MNSRNYAANLGGTLTGANAPRGPSPAIWGNCPAADFMEDPGKGMHFFDDMIVAGANTASGGAIAGSLGQWSAYEYQGAQINDGQLEGSVLRLSSDGDNEGVAYLSQGGAFRFVTTSTLALNGRMWFECRIAKSSVASAHLTCFAGLMKPTLASGLPAVAQPLTTTDDIPMTAGDLFGFLLSGTANGTTGGTMTEVGVTFVLASGTVNYPTNLKTLMASTGNTVLAADTFVKLGWVFDPNAATGLVTLPTARQTASQVRKKLIRFFVNGVEAPTFLDSDDIQNATATQAFPTAFMCPTVAMMNEASQSSDYMAVDWIRVAQQANS